MPGKLNLKINQGETFRYTLIWKDSNEVLIDLTGAAARMQVRDSHDSPTVLLSFSSNPADNPDGTLTMGGAAGTIEIYLSAAKTATVTWLSAVYDLEVIETNGDVTRLIEGKISVTKEVTR